MSLHDTLPPHSIESEQSVLGAIMLDNAVLDRVGNLSVRDFYVVAHGDIYAHARTLRDGGQPVDVTTLSAALASSGKLDNIGGPAYLGELLANVPTAANAEHYAGILRDRAALRRLAVLGERIRAGATGAVVPDPRELAATFRAELERIEVGPREALPLVWARDTAIDTATPYIVKGILAPGELAVVYGAPKSGKTFLAIDLALSVAAGLPWFGRRVRTGTVIYVASEMGMRIERRVAAWMADRLGDASDHNLPFTIVPIAVKLLDDNATGRLLDTARAVKAQRGGPALVAIDTLARSMTGGDENSAQDMGRALAVADRLRDSLGTATLVVHHEGKAAKGARGSSALLGAADAMIRVDHDPETGARAFEVEWARDGEAGQRTAFALSSVDLGTDDDGDRASTCIVEPTDALPDAAPGRKAPRINAAATIALRALADAIADSGERLPETSAIPPGKRGVTLDKWRERYHTIRTIEATEPAEARREAGARRKAFQRARDDLLAANLAATVNDVWWLA